MSLCNNSSLKLSNLLRSIFGSAATSANVSCSAMLTNESSKSLGTGVIKLHISRNISFVVLSLNWIPTSSNLLRITSGAPAKYD